MSKLKLTWALYVKGEREGCRRGLWKTYTKSWLKVRSQLRLFAKDYISNVK